MFWPAELSFLLYLFAKTLILCYIIVSIKKTFLRGITVKQILFVCSGNICRSPMAEAYFNMLARNSGSQWHAVSAGVCAAEGLPASAKAADVMKEYSASLDGFSSRPVSVGLLQDSELVICMEMNHCRAVSGFYSAAAGKTRLLTHWLHGVEAEKDIRWLSEDIDFYRSCFNTMKPALDNLFEYINQQ